MGLQERENRELKLLEDADSGDAGVQAGGKLKATQERIGKRIQRAPNKRPLPGPGQLGRESASGGPKRNRPSTPTKKSAQGATDKQGNPGGLVRSKSQGGPQRQSSRGKNG